MRERKIVLLDLDDTILDFHTAERKALKAAFEELDIAANEALLDRYSEINRLCWQQLERREMTREKVLVGRFEMLFAEKGIRCDAALAQELYENRLSVGHYFMPGAPELLKELQHDYDLYIISNGNTRVQQGRLKSAGIAPFFKDIFISELIGADKPSRAFFSYCFARIPEFRREDAVIVGDSLSSDIQGAINAGVTSCWFNPSGAPLTGTIRPDYVITGLDELPSLLKKIFAQDFR